MSLLDQAISGVSKHSRINLIYGPNSIGKTYFVANVPDILFADIEWGTKDETKVKRRLLPDKLPDYNSVVQLVNDFIKDNKGFKALAIDSLTTLDHYVTKSICEENHVKELGDIPFGKGTVLAKQRVREFMQLLRQLTNTGVDVWLIGHSQVKKHTDPTMMTQFDRFVLQLPEWFSNVVMQECDNVYFVKRKVSVTTDKTTKKTKGHGEGDKFLCTQYQAGYDAKNRLKLPSEIEFSYEKYIEALENFQPRSVDELKDKILQLITVTKTQNPELASIAETKLKEAGNDDEKLERIKNKLLNETLGV